MGGEAIKALQIGLELKQRNVRVIQVTHERVQRELEEKYPDLHVVYVRDTPFQKALYRFPPTKIAQKIVFFRLANKEIKKLLQQYPDAIVHFTSPVSPVLPYFRLRGAKVVIGPLNGNIHYPKAFRKRESLPYIIRRVTHPLLQFLHGLTSSGKQHADVLLVSGGERTFESLRMARCRDAQFVSSVDSGVLDALYEAPRVIHSGRNMKFYQNGRLVEHKGTDLVIRALTRTHNPIEFYIIGRGPELPSLRALTAELKLEDRVHFVEWVQDHSKLREMIREYRAFVFPSLAEANGIVVQEAMVMGLPVIALDWGGPQLLVTPETGILIAPRNEEYVIDQLAQSMDKLAEDGELAESMSKEARQRAVDEGYLWSGLIANWMRVYSSISSQQRPEASLSRQVEPAVKG
jgi:glycosyltransferase involved in cell wall biosynthesis